jgi:hypothetical protein
MPKSRKTTDIQPMREYANKLLASTYKVHDAQFRQGIIAMIEQLLHEAKAYRGFSYIASYELPDDVLPGVRYAEGYQLLPYPERFDNTDDTRRYYL